MNANILSLIFEYANKFELPSPPQEEKAIVAHIAKTSNMQRLKMAAYEREATRFLAIIDDLRNAFGQHNVVIHSYYGNASTYKRPGHAEISIIGYVSNISIRTDSYYEEPAAYVPNSIEVFGGIQDSEWPSGGIREYHQVQRLIEAIRHTPDWEAIQHDSPEESQDFYYDY